jgi:hypothetical protein
MHPMFSILSFRPSLAPSCPSQLSHKSVRPAFVNSDKPLKIRTSFYPTEVKQIRVAYHGLPGAYSEAVAVETYSNSIRMPCVDLESNMMRSNYRWRYDRLFGQYHETSCRWRFFVHDMIHHVIPQTKPNSSHLFRLKLLPIYVRHIIWFHPI